MDVEINDTDGAFISVEAGADSIASDGSVRVYAPANELAIPRDEPVALLDFTPAQARALAAALLRAADEAEGVTSPARSEYEMGESSGYADWAFAFFDIVPDDIDAGSPYAVAAWVREKLEEGR
ncbi:hypothetical protein OG554_03405 [Streptomyces griseus]|uniref:hypothetical protein n=1 Tax=Streptomyces griseus TaxID=1911 RepID=UPI003862EEEB|nr:hypothetical protein OG554_03405 [Streptomyces fimicarius]